MASIHREDASDGPRYRVKWRNRGEAKQRSTTCKTKEAATLVKRAAEHAHGIGVPYLGPEEEAAALAARRVDLRQAARDYLRERKRAGKSKGTLYQTDICLGLFFALLDPEGADLEEPPPLWSTDEKGAERLTSASLGAYYDHLLNVRKCSLSTARSHVEYVQRWWAWLGNSDVYGDRVPRPRTVEMAAPPSSPEPVAPTWLEMDRAIACAHDWYGHMMTVARLTGLRGEDQVMELRRDDLDFGGRTLRIRPELGKTPNEKRGRTVPVSRHLLEAVLSWPADPAGWLVHVPHFNPTKYPDPPKRRAWNAQASGAWRRAGVRAEVWDTAPATDGRRRNGHPIHAFRKGWITNLLAMGAPLNDVKYLVGHKLDGGVTVEHYSDPSVVLRLREVVDLVPAIERVETRRISGGGKVLNFGGVRGGER